MSKADNMLAILWLLKSGRRMTARELADELEIHVRTVYRYIDALCASGVPVVADSGHNGGYSLLNQFTEAPLLFDRQERQALMQAAVFAREAGYPYGEALARAVAKLQRYSNEAQRSELQKHLDGFEVIHPPADASPEAVVQELESAVAESRTLSMEYDKGSSAELRPRRIDPYGLVYWKGHWYVVAYCHLRQAIRSFRADRIRRIVQTGDGFDRPQGFSARQFFLGSLLPDPNKEEKLLTVRIQGKHHAINDLCGHWLFGHMLTERTADEVEFVIQEQAAIHYAPHILLSYGKSIRVLGPPLLKERMAAVSAELAEYYRSALH